MALGVCVYKSYEFRFTGLTCDEQTVKVPRTNQRPKCKIGKPKRQKNKTKTSAFQDSVPSARVINVNLSVSKMLESYYNDLNA